MTTEIPEVLDNDENSPGGMRATIERMSEQLKGKDEELGVYQVKDRARALDDSGLSGAALIAVSKDLTRGDYAGDVTAEALREYAVQEYEWEPSSNGDGDDPEPKEADEATQTRMDSQKSRDDLAASSHARGDSEESPESQQAAQDAKLDEGDVQGAVLDEITNKVSRARA